MNIMIVDDNVDLAAGLSDLLEIEGHNIVVTSTAKLAREQYGALTFDHVFLDMKLPDGNGLELYYEFHRKSPATKLTLMTGYRIEQLLQQLVEKGSVEVIRGPFTPDQCNRSLQNIMPEGMLLVVADSPDFPEVLATCVEEFGKKVAIIRDYEEAEAAIESPSVDLLIVDMAMPILCCAEIYLRMKKTGRVRPIAMVIDQTRIPGGVEDAFRSVGITNCLFKPFHPEEILEVIGKSRVV